MTAIAAALFLQIKKYKRIITIMRNGHAFFFFFFLLYLNLFNL